MYVQSDSYIPIFVYSDIFVFSYSHIHIFQIRNIRICEYAVDLYEMFFLYGQMIDRLTLFNRVCCFFIVLLLLRVFLLKSDEFCFSPERVRRSQNWKGFGYDDLLYPNGRQTRFVLTCVCFL